MADNVPISAGVGTSIAADNIAGVFYQRVKLVLGNDGNADGDLSSTFLLPISIPTAIHLTAAPTVTAGAYTTGQVVGGLISLAGASRVNAGSGTIQQALITVKTALVVPYDIFFFDTNPTNSTFTDNGAFAPNVLDLPSICGIAHCVDPVLAGTPTVLQAANVGLTFKLSASATTLYAVIVIRGSQSFASTSAIGLSVIIYPD